MKVALYFIIRSDFSGLAMVSNVVKSQLSSLAHKAGTLRYLRRNNVD